MSGPSLLWLDWRLSARSLVRESAARLLLLIVLASIFWSLLLSGGVGRFFSEKWGITAVLRQSVPAEEGQGIARKIGVLPAVRSAAYKDPEAAWREFLAAYPGLEPLRAAGGNPLPGYVEIRLRPDRLTEIDAAAIEDSLRPLPQVERLLTGGERRAALMRGMRWVNRALWGGFGLLCSLFFLVFVLQEKARACALLPDFAFLAEREVPGRRVALSRAAGACAAGAIVSLVAIAVVAVALHFLGGRMELFRLYVGTLEATLSPRPLMALGGFFLATVCLNGAASLLGWRAAQSSRK